MLVTVLDGNGNPVVICMLTQGAATDFSSSITDTDVSQQVAPANLERSGLYFQNRGINSMLVSELGSAEAANAYLISPGGTWPPPNYPIPTGVINVAGAAGDIYVYREW